MVFFLNFYFICLLAIIYWIDCDRSVNAIIDRTYGKLNDVTKWCKKKNNLFFFPSSLIQDEKSNGVIKRKKFRVDFKNSFFFHFKRRVFKFK